MKINDSVKSTAPISLVGEGQAGASKGGAPRTQGAGDGDTKVQLSSLSAQVKELAGRLSGGEVADPARVQEIKDAIADGRFRINPEAVADKVLESVRELLLAQKR